MKIDYKEIKNIKNSIDFNEDCDEVIIKLNKKKYDIDISNVYIEPCDASCSILDISGINELSKNLFENFINVKFKDASNYQKQNIFNILFIDIIYFLIKKNYQNGAFIMLSTIDNFEYYSKINNACKETLKTVIKGNNPNTDNNVTIWFLNYINI